MTPEPLSFENYNDQLAEKVHRLQTLLAGYAAPAPAIFPSPAQHYRMRAEFRLWHDGDDLYHVMFDQTTKKRIRIDRFPAACKLINQLMPVLLCELRSNHVLRHRLFQVDYLATLNQQIVVSLLYHRPLDEAWRREAQMLRDRLQKQGFALHLIGRAAKTKICLDQDYVDECLPVAGKSIIYRQPENSFTQPNALINIKMLEWALDVTQHAQGDLLELYCGNGNFSLALARNFRRVLATEIAKSSVAAAQYNIAANQITNVQIIRMSAEELTQAMHQKRHFRRLKDIDLTRYQFDTVLVDPPRCGLDDKTRNMVQAWPQILYISCNPDTLCRDLQTLTKTHTIARLALFDQFPWTHHMECGVLLTQR